MYRNLKYRILGIVTFVTTSLSCIQDKYDGGLDVGEPLPMFTINMSDGSSVNVPNDLQGSISCIVFFNTECPDCQVELPVIQKLHEARQDTKVIPISREEDAGSISNYWKENGLSMPFSAQSDRKIYSLFARSSIPRVYISDRSCRIRYIFTDAELPTFEMLLECVKGLKSEGSEP